MSLKKTVKPDLILRHSAHGLNRVITAPVENSWLNKLIDLAIEEDMPEGDITSDNLFEASQNAKAFILTKQDAVVCGINIAKKVFQRLDKHLKIKVFVEDGQKVKAMTRVLSVSGNARAILGAERIALNFLSYLSAIATKTRTFIDAIKPYQTHILDTRKTTPTLRPLERYAVACAGGRNHRDHLSAMIMIKDNHWACLPEQNIEHHVKHLQKKCQVPVEIEVDQLSRLKQVLLCGADIILLDNMTPAQVKKAVSYRNKINKTVLLEVSGGVKLKNVRQYAKTGVERISIGELTHSREAIDFSLEIIR